MANELEVDASGLRVAAASSDGIAAGLTGAQVGSLSASHPSAVGVAAVNAALTAVQGRQSQRMTGQAHALSTSGAVYAATDSDGADAITTVSL